MAIKDNTAPLLAKVGVFAGQQATAQSLSSHAESLNGERESNGFRTALEVVGNIGTSSDILALCNKKRRNEAEEIIKQPLRALKAAQRSADAAEEAGEAGRLIPVSALRTPAKALDKGSEAFLRAVARPIEVMETVRIRLRETNAKFDRVDEYLDIIGNFGNVATVALLIDDYTGFISAREAEQANAVETAFARGSAALAISTGPEDDDLNDLVLPEEVAARLETVYAIFDDRAGERSRLLVEEQEVMASLGDKAAAMSPDALEGAAKVLNIALDAIQPVLDFFGPVVRLIDGVLSATEKAIGLDKLDQIDALLEPILSQLQEIIDQLDVDLFSFLDAYFADLIEIRQKLEDPVVVRSWRTRC